MRTIYLDLDGVMADFDTHFRNEFGWLPNDDLTDEHWTALHAKGDFFLSMPLKADAERLFKGLPRLPVILTACPKTKYQEVARQKRQWCRKHIGDNVIVLPILGGHNKPMFMHQMGDILIDDFGKNCRAWDAEGGVSIKHISTTDTLEKLNAIW